MIRNTIALIFLMATLPVYLFSQQSAVNAVMERYNLDRSLLNPIMANNALEYTHELTRVVTTDNGAKTYISRYDPGKEGLQRWQLISVNGKPPTKKELKAFDREHEFKSVYKLDTNSLKIVGDNGKQLSISFQYDPSTIDSDHRFLNDCMFTFVINTTSRKLERITQKNLKELKVKIVKMPKLIGESTFIYHDNIHRHLISRQEVTAVIRLMGNQTGMTTVDTYKYSFD